MDLVAQSDETLTTSKKKGRAGRRAAAKVGEEERGIRATALGDGLVLVAVSFRDTRQAPRSERAALSPGEDAVVELAALGLSNREIALRRGCSVRTVANQLASAYRKLRVSGRRELRARLRSPSERA